MATHQRKSPHFSPPEKCNYMRTKHNGNYEGTKRNGGSPLLLQAERLGVNSGLVEDKRFTFTDVSLCWSFVSHTSGFKRELKSFSIFTSNDSGGQGATFRNIFKFCQIGICIHKTATSFACRIVGSVLPDVLHASRSLCTTTNAIPHELFFGSTGGRLVRKLCPHGCCGQVLYF